MGQNPMTSYVTGANGFLGRHLVAKLTGETIKIPHERISTFEFVDFSKFFFLSTYGNMAEHQGEVGKILRANIMDLAHVIESILRYKLNCDLFMFVSSSSVNLPVQTPYSQTKQMSEWMLGATKLPVCIVRPFSVTGVGEQEQHLIPTLIRSCMEGEPMDFVPDAVHDFVDADDVAQGLINLAERKAVGIFEFGSGASFTNKAVLDLVEAATGKKANIREVKNLRAYDNKKWCCKDFRAQQFGWEPKKTLLKSIGEMVEAYKDQ